MPAATPVAIFSVMPEDVPTGIAESTSVVEVPTLVDVLANDAAAGAKETRGKTLVPSGNEGAVEWQMFPFVSVLNGVSMSPSTPPTKVKKTTLSSVVVGV